MRIVFLFCLMIISLQSIAQSEKKIMDHGVFDIWNTISNEDIADNGKKVVYQINPGSGDPSTALFNVKERSTLTFPRATNPRLTQNGQYLFYTCVVPKDSLDQLKREKTKKKDLPRDTLAIYNSITEATEKIADLKSFFLPSKWSSHVIYALHPQKEITQDTTKKDQKKESEKNGSKCIVRNIQTQKEDTLSFTTNYIAAEEGNIFAAISTGPKDTTELHIYQTDTDSWSPIYKVKGKVSQLSFSEKGRKLAFMVDRDTTDVLDRPIQLFLWETGDSIAHKVADNSMDFIGNKWNISPDYQPHFSEDENYLYYGTKPPVVSQDTTLLPEEIVNVEVWSYKDQTLHTRQNALLETTKKKSYLAAYNLQSNQNRQLATENISYGRTTRNGNGKYVLGVDEEDYLINRSWLGYWFKDLFLIDKDSGKKFKIASKITGNPKFSNNGKFLYWYSAPDTAWLAYHLESKTPIQLTDNSLGIFYDELNDRPMHPRSYGNSGWSENDQYVYINDHYDIWQIDPLDPSKTKRLTQGREDKIRYRYITVDREEKFIDTTKNMLLYIFDEKDKSGGYATLEENKVTTIIKGPYSFEFRPTKAKDNTTILFTKENFNTYPNLAITDDGFLSHTTISDVNPQQKEYRWGNASTYRWKSMDGMELEGILVTPEGFDPTKKYPLLVNFYERSSHNLHKHRAPYPGRSTINYSFYTNRGYVIFNPDVFYPVGRPGDGAYNCVVSGVESLIQKGFIDKDRIGVQGHSWGGYQIAHLVTKTDMFACAESGAPVVNMISAYGGIRWATGLSRMFQYEHTQSRIGSTLWDGPHLYIENSPIFNIDKINTPILIMHNDKDGHVPWYQGIEFFVALRRLGKPSWMLNYNGEPHWPLKRQNRLDFNKRMQQYFDHYLMDAPMPPWMKNGVSAIDKGINQGYE